MTRTRIDDEQFPESPTFVEGLFESDVKDVWQMMDTPKQVHFFQPVTSFCNRFCI